MFVQYTLLHVLQRLKIRWGGQGCATLAANADGDMRLNETDSAGQERRRYSFSHLLVTRKLDRKQ